MLALILGTAALPHILIRYYTVPKPSDARKSTVVAIIAIGMFYILTLFLGLGANYFAGQGEFLVNDSNLSAPTLANYIGGEAVLRHHLVDSLRHHPGDGVRA